MFSPPVGRGEAEIFSYRAHPPQLLPRPPRPRTREGGSGSVPRQRRRPRQARSLRLGRPARGPPRRPPPRARSAPRGLRRGAALLHPLRAPLALGWPRRPRALRGRFPPAAPGNPDRLVAEPARAATCRGRRASQRPAAAILHFKAAALFRESTLTCEPYTRNRSAGRHTASELGGPGGAWRVGGEGTRRGARPGGRRGVRGAERSRPRRGPRARAPSARPCTTPLLALHSQTLLLLWGSTRASAPWIGARREGSRPAPLSTEAPPPPAEAPPPPAEALPSPGLGAVPPLASDSSALYQQKPSLRLGLSRRQLPRLSVTATPTKRPAFLLSLPNREK